MCLENPPYFSWKKHKQKLQYHDGWFLWPVSIVNAYLIDQKLICMIWFLLLRLRVCVSSSFQYHPYYIHNFRSTQNCTMCIYHSAVKSIISVANFFSIHVDFKLIINVMQICTCLFRLFGSRILYAKNSLLSSHQLIE